MALVAELVTELKLKSNEFTKEIHEAQKETENFGKTAKIVSAGIVAGFVAIAGAIPLIDRAISDNLESIDELGKSARALGIDFAVFQQLKFAAGLEGTTIDAVSNSVVRLTRSLAMASTEGSEASKAFKMMGIDVASFMGLGQEEKIARLSVGFRSLSAGTERLTAGLGLFGRSAKETMNFFTSDLAESAKQFKSFDITLTEAQLSAAEKANDAKFSVQTMFAGFSDVYAAEVAPFFLELYKAIEKTVVSYGGLRAAARSMAESTVDFMTGIISAVNSVVKAVDFLINKFKDLERMSPEILSRFAMVGRFVGNAISDTIDSATGNPYAGTKSAFSLDPNMIGSVDKNKADVGPNRNTSPILEELVKSLGNVKSDLAKPEKLDSFIQPFKSSLAKAGDAVDGMATKIAKFTNSIDSTLGGFVKADFSKILAPLNKKQVISEDFSQIVRDIVDSMQSGLAGQEGFRANMFKKAEGQVKTDMQYAYLQGGVATGEQSALKELAKYLTEHGDNLGKQQEVKVTVAPTTDFIVKVSESAYTDRKIEGQVLKLARNEATGVRA